MASALAVGAGGVVWTFFFSLSSIISLLSPSFWKTTRYKMEYSPKGPLNPTNQPI